MTHYLLSVHQGVGDPPSAERLSEISRDVLAVRQEMRSAGSWVFSGGLQAPSTATVVHPGHETVPTTDVPYVESKEHLGGLTFITASDPDEALEWAQQARSRNDPAHRGTPFRRRRRALTLDGQVR